ncbi:MAG: hypothetical protein MJH09_05745 [Cetobacterium sp.]|nr:hypothetical protein [Cetobacterium sp.]
MSVILDTNINIFLEIDKDNLIVKEDGTSSFILKTRAEEEDEQPSILQIIFNQKQTKLISNMKKSTLDGKVLFVQGSYQILKNKKDVSFAKVKAFRVMFEDKTKTLKIQKLRNKLTEEFKKEDVKTLQEKYEKFFIDRAIKELKNELNINNNLKLKDKLNKQELHKLKLRNSALKKLMQAEEEAKKGKKYKREIRQWSDKDN